MLGSCHSGHVRTAAASATVCPPQGQKCHSCLCGRTRTVATSATVWPRLRLRHATPATVAADGLMCIRPCLPSPGLTKCHSRHFGRMRTDAESASVCPPLGSRRTTPATLAACGPLRMPPLSATPWTHKIPPATPATPDPPITMLEMRIMMMRKTMAEEDTNSAKGALTENADPTNGWGKTCMVFFHPTGIQPHATSPQSALTTSTSR